MKNTTKTWLIAAAVMILTGIIILAGALMINKWNLSSIGIFTRQDYHTVQHEITEDFDDISIETDTADILFVLSLNGRCAVDCYETEKTPHSVSVEHGTLKITSADYRKWYDHISFFNAGDPRITVYLPKAIYNELLISEHTGDVELPKEFTFNHIGIAASTGDVECYASARGSVEIALSTGDIKVEDITAEKLALSVSTGHVRVSGAEVYGGFSVSVSTGDSDLEDVKCLYFESTGDTGRLNMKDMTARDTFNIRRSTGDVKLDDCDAAELYITTDTGDVSGTLLTDKVFLTESDTGRIDVPKTITGGRCEIKTDTGDISFRVDK
ncbi:MAG: DUF4097 family beta strand repeat protein [Lachnospiraceae bacterium]|nr:DUF4097 family beta strand repeat protein [Lachnospiraceae bacterium]